MKSLNFVVILIILSVFFMVFMGPEKFPFHGLYSTKRKEHEKKQWVRLLDIFVLGPFALWLGYTMQKDDSTKWKYVPYLLYAYAYGTIVYNFMNYYKNCVAN